MEKIQLAHGGGGKLTDDLINNTILKYLPGQSTLTDSAKIDVAGTSIALTTDSYVVHPLFFPGGDIGKLCICGTCNDLAMIGAVPQAISLALIIEEGFPMEHLEQILESIGRTCREANVNVLTGDTKVVEHGKADGLYINTAGVGQLIDQADLGFDRIQEDDQLLISGTIGDHGLAIMAQREGLEFQTPIASDVAPVSLLANELVRQLGKAVKFLRDPTRAGLAGVLNDISNNTGHDMLVDESAIPMTPAVRSAAEVLGLDPLIVANEGKFLAVVAEDTADKALKICRNHPLGRSAGLIGQVLGISKSPKAFMETTIGGRRVIQKPYGENLPRIC